MGSTGIEEIVDFKPNSPLVVKSTGTQPPPSTCRKLSDVTWAYAQPEGGVGGVSPLSFGTETNIL